MTARSKAKKAPARKKPAPKAAKKVVKPVARKPKAKVKPKAKPRATVQPVSAAPAVEAPPVRKVGRPTDYRPEYVDEVIQWTRETGGSLDAFAGSRDFSRSTLDNWRKRYPDFDEACKISHAVRTFVLEPQAAKETNGPQMNYKLLALKNCAPESWREQQDHRIGGLPGAPPIGTATVDTSHLTPDQVYAYVINGAPLPPPPAKEGEAEPAPAPEPEQESGKGDA